MLTVENVFVTTSGSKYLGTDDGGLLQDGDDLEFSFSARSGFGLYIISADELLDGDFELTSGLFTATLSAIDIQDTLSDGSNVWFLGLGSIDGSTLTSAILTTHGGGGAFLYNVDDVVTTAAAVPEVGAWAFGLAVAGLVVGYRFFLGRRPSHV
jgi:hypothetical protein